MQYSGLSPGVVTVSQNLTIHTVAPDRVSGDDRLSSRGATSSQPVHVRIFISGTSWTDINIPTKNDTVSGQVASCRERSRLDRPESEELPPDS